MIRLTGFSATYWEQFKNLNLNDFKMIQNRGHPKFSKVHPSQQFIFEKYLLDILINLKIFGKSV
jgi:hypothetical protein